MASVNLWTYSDLLDHLYDFVGANVDSLALRDCRRAAQAAYRDLPTAHDWTYFYAVGRLTTSAAQVTGTVQYTHTGGTYERQLTLTGAAWPAWAAQGVVGIANVAYTVADLKSATVLTLAANSNPGQDVAAGTNYTLYRDTYPLPADFRKGYGQQTPTNWGGLVYQHPSEWLGWRTLAGSLGRPYRYTVAGDDNYLGTLALRLYPPPDAAYPLDFLYQRNPRALVVEDYHDGTATVAQNGTTLTGAGTAWAAKHVGSVVLLAANGDTAVPTGRAGASPYSYQRVVMDAPSATQLTLDAAVPEALSAVKYRLSDPVDVEEGAMFSAFLRAAEYQLGVSRRLKDLPAIAAVARQALLEAKAADARVGVLRGVGWEGGLRRSFRHMPLGADRA